ncbi:hypothetical protein KC351_g13598 [Hortaea werneckii]|nr:hypothetical protein KC351_g13598 [Hortaea werneckii]
MVDRIRSAFYELIIAKCRSTRVSRLKRSGNERRCEPDQSGEDESEASNDFTSDEASDGTPAPEDDTSNDPDHQPCRRSSEPDPSPVNSNGHSLGYQREPETPQTRLSRHPSRRHGQDHPEDDCSGETRAWAREPRVVRTSRLKRQRQSSEPAPATVPTADMSRRIIFLKLDPQKLRALLRRSPSNSKIIRSSSEITIKEEEGPDKQVAGSPTMREATRRAVLLELNTTIPPVIDLTDDEPQSLGERDQLAVAEDSRRAATVPPTPVSLFQNLDTTASVGRQSSSQPHSVQLVAPEPDTIAVSTDCLEARIADSLGGIFPGDTSHTDANASEEQCNELRPTNLGMYLPQQPVGTANYEEDLYSSTPPPPNMHSRDTIQPIASASMWQPDTIGDHEWSTGDGLSLEPVGVQADGTRLRGGGGHLASPMFTGPESGQPASQVADESRHADTLSSHIEQMAKEDADIEERIRQMRQKLREQERTLREEGDAASRRIAERARECQQLERQLQDVARQTKAMRQIGQPASLSTW